MSILEAVFDYTLSFGILIFETYCYLIFLGTFLSRRWQFRGFVPAAAGCTVLLHMLFVFLFSGHLANIFMAIVMLFIISSVFFLGHLLIKLVLTFFYFVLISSIDYCLVFGMALFTGMNSASLIQSRRYYVLISVVSKLLIFIMVFILRQLWRDKKTIPSIGRHDFVYLLFYPLLSIIGVFGIANIYGQGETASVAIIVYGVIIFAMNIYTVVVLEAAAKRHKTEQHNEVLQQQVAFGTMQLQTLTESQDHLRGQAHDYKNHLHNIHGLLVEGRTSEAREYIQEISNIVENSISMIYTHNHYFDAILNHKFTEMRRHGINVQVQVADFSGYEGVSPYDLVTILGNTMDNAIEASLKNSSKKEIEIFLKLKNGIFTYVISNIVDEPVAVSAFEDTDKADVINHGYGLKNVKRAVEKYNGELEIYYKDGRVTFVCIL